MGPGAIFVPDIRDRHLPTKEESEARDVSRSETERVLEQAADVRSSRIVYCDLCPGDIAQGRVYGETGESVRDVARSDHCQNVRRVLRLYRLCVLSCRF